MKVTILGSANSRGVPAPGNDWGVCDPSEPRNARTRASILVQSDETNLLVDCSPDFRYQSVAAELMRIDAVLFTHAHADHCHGIDDLKIYFDRHPDKKIIEVYGDVDAHESITSRFSYAFNGGQGFYKPFLHFNVLKPGAAQIRDIPMMLFTQEHGNIQSFGMRFNDFAYSTDMNELDEDALNALGGIDTWVVDGAAYKVNNGYAHAGIEKVIEWVDLIKPRITYVTDLTNKMDYQTLCEELPPHIRPAYDGLEIEI